MNKGRWTKAGMILAALVVVSIPVAVVFNQPSASSASPSSKAPAVGNSQATATWAKLLSLSKDLGPSKVDAVDVLVTLKTSSRPELLYKWARAQHLTVTWYQDEKFANLSGTAASVGTAFGVSVDSYRSRTGEDFFAATRQPGVPAAVSSEVNGVGRISNYGRLDNNLMIRDFVPTGGITPTGLIQAYQANPLTGQGLQGQGETVVFYELSPFEQTDLNLFTQKFNLPQIQIQVVGGNAQGGAAESGEADMDIETVHGIVPQAKLVYFNILTAPGLTNSSDLGSAVALSISAVNKEFPGAVGSMSIGACELQQNSTDIAAINNAAAAAEANGSTLYASSGDTGGADCGQFGADSLSSAKGVEIPAAAPNMTGTGGTSLSVTTNGDYLGETTWSSSMLSQGSGGGVSTIAARPSYQTGKGVGGAGIPGGREVPDVSSDSDPNTGNAFFTQGQLESGGGTSLAAPTWAGFTALIDEFLRNSGQHPIGFANPILYSLANDNLSPSPFHDITVGGNVFYRAGPGYDPITGVGSPNVAALAQYILDIDKTGKP